MKGYNDDLVMSFSIALWIRDTALRLKKDKNDQQWAVMNGILQNNGNSEAASGFSTGKKESNNPYEMNTGKDIEDLSWLIK